MNMQFGMCGLLLYWFIEAVSATTYDRSSETISDITTITIPSSTTKAELDNNRFGDNGIPLNYFSVSTYNVLCYYKYLYETYKILICLK